MSYQHQHTRKGRQAIGIHNVSHILTRLADITRSCLRERNMEKAAYYLSMAEDIYKKGNAYTRNLVANIFVFSVSAYCEICRLNIRKAFPESLLKEYRKRVGGV